MNRDFKGIWIPKEIWLAEGLAPTEKFLWAEIHSLYDPERGGCYASNEYLMQFMGVKERRLQEIIANLKAYGLLTQVSFDGRERILKAICPPDGFIARTSEVHYNAPLGCIIMHLSDALKCTPPLYREKSLDKSIEIPPIPQKGEPPSGAKNEVLLSHGSHVKLKAIDLKSLEDKHGAKKVAEFIERVNDYCASKGKTYKDWAAAIRNFIRNDDAKNPESPTFDNKAALLRRKNSKLSTPGDFEDDGFKRKRLI